MQSRGYGGCFRFRYPEFTAKRKRYCGFYNKNTPKGNDTALRENAYRFLFFIGDGGKIFVGIAGFLPGKRIDKKIRLGYNFIRQFCEFLD